MALTYKKVFDPPAAGSAVAPNSEVSGDRRDGEVYIYNDKIVLAVNVAIATGRPLLVRGPSGSGKSSLARNVARILKRRYYEDVISSATQARDLLWKFDTVAQLADASRGKQYEVARYIDPGVLWWAFDKVSARRRGFDEKSAPSLAKDPSPLNGSNAVVLLDEIDKADPDVPNNLLVPLGSLQFIARFPGREVIVDAQQPPLVIITTNDERDLPNAFVRRCVVTTFARPDREGLIAIARAHFGKDSDDLFGSIAGMVEELAAKKERHGFVAPSTAEYLDAISACRRLKVSPKGRTDVWQEVANAVLEKPRPGEELPQGG